MKYFYTIDIQYYYVLWSSEHIQSLLLGHSLVIILLLIKLFSPNVPFYGIDEQWRRQLAQIIIPTPIALREYVREVIGQ